MINQVNAMYLNKSSTDRNSNYVPNKNDLLTQTNNSYIDNNINHTQLKQHLNTAVPNPTNVVDIDVNVHNNQYQSLNRIQSNIIAPTNVIDLSVDPNLLYHCELALQKHLQSTIIQQQNDIDIEKLIYEKTLSKDFFEYTLHLINKSKYLNRLMILLHSNKIYDEEESDFMKCFDSSMKNKRKFEKGQKANEEYKALNKIKTEFHDIIRQLCKNTGFFNNDKFLKHRTGCVVSIAKAIHKVLFNNINGFENIPFLSITGTSTCKIES